ncbi:MAG TPA: AAA family ATPase [Phycisphaerae bacterium]|nr:AAA family ATPase [Phycisphaerae bacterium]
MIKAASPSVIVLAGPNGAGKTTAAPRLLKGSLDVTEFVNTDLIAEGLSGFAPEGTALLAAEAMLSRIRTLARQRVSFAFETTLVSRSLLPWLRELVEDGYRFHLVFLWLPSVDLAVNRVACRVRLGGHNVPKDTIRRRYDRGLRNFFQLHRPIATTWRMYDNSHGRRPRRIASGAGGRTTRIVDEQVWNRILREHAT